MKKKYILLIIIAILAILLAVLGTVCNPYWNSHNPDSYSKPYDYELTSKEAMADLEYAMKYLKKLHPALYKEVPEAVAQRYEAVKAKLASCESIMVNELEKEIEFIFAALRDGHTSVFENSGERRILKYYRQWISEGYEIVAINGVSIEELLERNSEYYSYEVTSWQYETMLDDMLTVVGLDYLGFDVTEGVEYTLMSQDGSSYTEICYSDDYLVWEEYAEFNNIADDETTEQSFVTYEIDTENNVAILYLDSCTYNDEYKNCVRQMFEEVKEKGIANVAVDLRYNGGGSSLVVNEFFKYFDIDSYKVTSMGWRLGFLYLQLGSGVAKNEKYEELLFDGNLYLLTSTNTFSSAMMFAQYVKDNSLGTIIGEAPGNNPNGYGEIVYFQLPNSELYMCISTKRFYRADKESTDELVYPDIECDSDGAMDELYRRIANR